MKINEVMNIQTDVTDKIAKAKALCTEVVTQYCEYDKADPLSNDERERNNAYDLCAHYPTWSLLLHCAWDMLEEAEKLAWQVVDVLDERDV